MTVFRQQMHLNGSRTRERKSMTCNRLHRSVLVVRHSYHPTRDEKEKPSGALAESTIQLKRILKSSSRTEFNCRSTHWIRMISQDCCGYWSILSHRLMARQQRSCVES